MNDAAQSWCAHSRQDVASILRVSLYQVDQLIARGDLPAFRVGKHVRVADSVLRDFAGQASPRGAAS